MPNKAVFVFYRYSTLEEFITKTCPCNCNIRRFCSAVKIEIFIRILFSYYLYFCSKHRLWGLLLLFHFFVVFISQVVLLFALLNYFFIHFLLEKFTRCPMRQTVTCTIIPRDVNLKETLGICEYCILIRSFFCSCSVFFFFFFFKLFFICFVKFTLFHSCVCLCFLFISFV